MMNVRIFVIMIFFFVGCNDVGNKKREKKDKSIKKISILLSGRGREIVVTDSTEDIFIPKEFASQIYLIELNEQGDLKTSVGYGQVDWNKGSKTNDIKLKYIEDKDSTTIVNFNKQKVLSIAGRLFYQDVYRTRNHPTDSWLVKLTLDNKTSIYYVGEDISKTDEAINKDYRDIIDLIVKDSPIRIREYR